MWRKISPVLSGRLANSPGMRAFIGNSGWLLFDKCIRMTLGVLVGAWVARYLGPNLYGALSYAIAFIAVFTAVAGLGADGITVRDIARQPAAAAEILGTAAYLRLFVGVICLSAAIIIAALTCQGDYLQVWLIGIIGSVLVFQAGDTIDLWFQSRSQNRRTVIAKLSAYSISNSVKVVLILLKGPLIAFALVLMLDSVTALIALVFAYRGFPADQRWRYSRHRASKLWRDCRPFMFGGFLLVLYMRIDQIMVNQLMGGQSLGIYAAAVWLLQLWQVIPTTLATSLGPYIARRKALSEALYRNTLIVIFRIFFFTGVASALITFVVAPVLIHVVYGSAYAGAVSIMRVYALTLPALFLSLGHNLWLFNEGKYMVRVYGAVAAAFSTVAIIYFLAPKLGVLSASVAAVVSQFIASFLINAAFDKQAFRMQIRAITFR